MTQISKKHVLLPLLVLGVTLALAAGVQAQERQGHASSGTSATLQINFGTTPRWSGIHGTGVREIRGDRRPDYDMFRYGNRYYVYSNERWYMSRRSHGQFVMIDERYVPREFSRVPRNHWRNYPSNWQSENQGPNDRGNGNGERRH